MKEQRNSKVLSNSTRSRRWTGLAVAVLLLVTIGGPAAADHAADTSVMVIDGCNEQPIGESGATVVWTSAFKDGHYDFAGTQQGGLLNGHGPLLEATVQWSLHDSQGAAMGVPSAVTDIAFRGAGFTPDGVNGQIVDSGPAEATAVGDASACNVGAEHVREHTFTFEFTTLHKPGKRSIAKGNAQLILTIAAGEDLGTATLGTNLHVATGDDPDA